LFVCCLAFGEVYLRKWIKQRAIQKTQIDALRMSWPEFYGFQIYGNGPSFIVAVQDGSVAEKSGLRPGDQILQVFYEF